MWAEVVVAGVRIVDDLDGVLLVGDVGRNGEGCAAGIWDRGYGGGRKSALCNHRLGAARRPLSQAHAARATSICRRVTYMRELFHPTD